MSVVKIEQRGSWVFTTDIVIFISNILIAHLCNIMQANKNVCVAFLEGLRDTYDCKSGKTAPLISSGA